MSSALRVVALMAAVAGLGSSATATSSWRGDDVDATERRTIMAVRAALSVVAPASCPATCETYICISGHRVQENEANGSYGPPHACQTTTTGCEYHQCFNEEQQQEMDALVETLPQLSPEALRSLAASEPALSINSARRTVQVFSCDGVNVTANVPLSPMQRAVLTDQ